MTTDMTCEQFEARLPDYLEGDLTGDERDAFERHAEDCAHCRPILNDLKAIIAGAAALGPIEPSRDLWSGIETRISAPVIPLASRRMIPLARGLAAAVVLMAMTAGITYRLTKRGSVAQQTIATSQPAPVTLAKANSDDPGPGGPGPIIVTKPPQVAVNTAGNTGSPDATSRSSKSSQRSTIGSGEPTVTAVRNGGRAASTAAVYDREIARLHSVIERRRGELDPKTVAAIERSLAVIDTAIAQARSALAADPASRFLHGRLNDVLDKKVELLRTTAMLPARS
jgi:hypothetical protein